MKSKCRHPLVAMIVAISAAATSSAFALDCKNAETTPDLNECARLDYKSADRHLNEAYQNALSRIEKFDLPIEGQRQFKNALQDAQRKWLPFRDAQCELSRYKAYGGTMATMIALDCLKDETERRIRDLSKIAMDDAETPLAGPSQPNPPPVRSESGSNQDLRQLCADYNESYDQNMRLDIASGRLPSDPQARSSKIARFREQASVCPGWQKQQALETKKRFLPDLRAKLIQNPRCEPYKKDLEGAFQRAIGYPELDEKINEAANALGLGQKLYYCRIIKETTGPYLQIRDIAAKCDPNLSVALNMTFGGVADEAQSNGCH